MAEAISVVVPTFNRRESVRRALDTLARQTMSPSSFEVVVSIDGSEDGTRELVAGYNAPFSLRGIWQPNRGRAGACNAGIRAARGELIILLDDDMEPVAGFLEAHRAEHTPGRARGVVGAVPIRHDRFSPPIVRYVGQKFDRHFDVLSQPGYRVSFREFYSGNFSIPRAVLLEVGVFDEDFRVYGNEDGELALRLMAAGVELTYSSAALARQHYEKTFAMLARDWIAQGRTAVLCGRKHPDWVSRLMNYENGSSKWRALRAGLLRASRVFPKLPNAVVFVVQNTERILDKRGRALWGGRIDFYGLALDYFFWLGARPELDRAPDTEPPSNRAAPVASRR